MTATLALADRLARLERTVASLQGQQPGAEALQPTYLTVDAQGHVSATFSGIVNAAGLVIAAGIGAGPPLVNRVSWQRSSDGKQVASLAGWDAGAGAHLDMLALDPDSAPLSSTGITAYSGSAAGGSEVDVSAGDSTGTAGARLLDSAGRSTFLQLLSAQQLQVVLGTATFTWPGGSNVTGMLTIAHGLGRTPICAGAFMSGGSSGFHAFADNWVNPDATNIYLVLVDPLAAPPAGQTRPAFWIAIG